MNESITRQKRYKKTKKETQSRGRKISNVSKTESRQIIYFRQHSTDEDDTKGEPSEDIRTWREKSGEDFRNNGNRKLESMNVYIILWFYVYIQGLKRCEKEKDQFMRDEQCLYSYFFIFILTFMI